MGLRIKLNLLWECANLENNTNNIENNTNNIENSTNIYFIGNVDLGAVKIGKRNNPEKRLSKLQTGNPYKLVLYSVVDNVTSDYEMRLHRFLDPLKMEGEWFKLTDDLIHFMINKTDTTSYDFKTTHCKTKPDPLETAIDKIVKPNKNGRGWVGENHLIEIIRKYLLLNDESPNFDLKKLRRKLENKGIYGTNSGGIWIYRDYHADETEIQPAHYLGPESLLTEDIRMKWNEAFDESGYDNIKHKNIKFTTGYSQVYSTKDGLLNVFTVTATAPGRDNPVVIYKGGVFDASCTLIQNRNPPLISMGH